MRISNITFCIDPGHGSDTKKNTGGKFSPITGMEEYEFNNGVAKYLMELCDRLRIEYINVASEDKDTPLLIRTNRANNFYREHKGKPCVYVSLHANAGGGTGAEIWAIHNATRATKKLANTVLTCVCKETAQRKRGVKLGYVNNPNKDFHVNRETDMVSMLIEYGFMDSNFDCDKLLDENFRKQCAIGTLKGILKYYGIKTPSVPPSTTVPSLPPKVDDKTQYKTLYEKEKVRTAYYQGKLAEVKKIVG